MTIENSIIKSILETDLYKINMGSVVFHHFPNARVKYRLFNRGKTKFPDGFAEELRMQLEWMADLSMSHNEKYFLNCIPYLRRTYVDWFSHYNYDPDEVNVIQSGGDLSVEIQGYWYRNIHWEVSLMAVISELYFKMTGQVMEDNWFVKMVQKATNLSNANCYWIDFGTRRRFSFYVQDQLVGIMKSYRGFLGTSNPYLAMKHGVTPHGTFAHEYVMGISAIHSDFVMANKMAMKYWSEHFNGNVGIALTDTFTTTEFLKSFETYEARLFDGVRHDSGDPFEWGEKILAHYNKLGINPSNKRLVFSDALTVDKYIRIHNAFNDRAQPVAGIGTHFTNDVGNHVTPLNIVIKMISADVGYGMTDVVKISDDISKATGNKEKIESAKKRLNIS